MPRYRKKPIVIEAFRLGVDYMPDWFMDAVTANTVILHGTLSGFGHHDDTNADIWVSLRYKLDKETGWMTKPFQLGEEPLPKITVMEVKKNATN